MARAHRVAEFVSEAHGRTEIRELRVFDKREKTRPVLALRAAAFPAGRYLSSGQRDPRQVDMPFPCYRANGCYLALHVRRGAAGEKEESEESHVRSDMSSKTTNSIIRLSVAVARWMLTTAVVACVVSAVPVVVGFPDDAAAAPTTPKLDPA